MNWWFLAAYALTRRGPWRPRSRAPGIDYVYVIKGEHGRIKIGSSIDPETRCRELQTGSPFRLWVDHVVPIRGLAAPVELEAHAILDRHRTLGEWFAIPTEAAIAAIHAAAYRLGARIAVPGEAEREPQPASLLRTTLPYGAPFAAILALAPSEGSRIVLAAGYLFAAGATFGYRTLMGSPVRL